MSFDYVSEWEVCELSDNDEWEILSKTSIASGEECPFKKQESPPPLPPRPRFRTNSCSSSQVVVEEIVEDLISSTPLLSSNVECVAHVIVQETALALDEDGNDSDYSILSDESSFTGSFRKSFDSSQYLGEDFSETESIASCRSEIFELCEVLTPVMKQRIYANSNDVSTDLTFFENSNVQEEDDERKFREFDIIPRNLLLPTFGILLEDHTLASIINQFVESEFYAQSCAMVLREMGPTISQFAPSILKLGLPVMALSG